MTISTSPRWLLAAAPLIALACVTDPDLDETISALTSTIPTSETCNQGLGPMQCTDVPPIEAASLAHWSVDGVHGAGEYAAATKLAFTTDTSMGDIFSKSLRGQGDIYLQRVTVPTGVTRDLLYVMLENIVVPRTGSAPLGKLVVYIDNARFDGATTAIDAEDRRYLIDLAAGGTVSVQRPIWLNGTQSWMPVTGVIGLAYAPGGCVNDATHAFARCRGELKIPLASTAVDAPAAGLAPGIGFFVRHQTVTRASAPAMSAPSYQNAAGNRGLWPTLLFREPTGIDLDVMTWNVRRFETLLEFTAFEDVTSAAIGFFLARHDIVAMQEGWNVKLIEEIQNAANAIREAEGLAPYHLYGPVDYEPSWLDFFANLADIVGETQGGLWVMSHLPLAGKDYIVFPQTACRGEDCLQAKGVQWVRLLLQDPGNVDPGCKPNITGHASGGCPKAPSGDDYVDVFNTHLQATAPLLCIGDEWTALKSDILDLIAASPLGALLDPILDVVENDLNCGSLTDSEARLRQLQHMNAFVERVVGPTPDRPALLVGDFNIDGKRIDDPVLGLEYRRMLTTLEIASAADPFSDAISSIPAPWDVKHGDVVRELPNIDWATGRCIGTAIGEDEGWVADTCTIGGRSDANERLDYILVRPPALPGAVTEYPRWYVMPGDKVWRSPFPSSTGAFAYEPPARLSDHKPVVSMLTMVRLHHPPAYNPTWPHDARLRVISVDATGIDDCIGCGQVDPYADLKARTLPDGLSVTKQTTECTGNQSASYANDTCMRNWYLDRRHTPGTVTAVDLSAKIRDDDNSSDDDALDEGTRMKFSFDVGGAGLFELRYTIFGQTFVDASWPVYEGATMPGCTGIPVDVCYEIELEELAPGE